MKRDYGLRRGVICACIFFILCLCASATFVSALTLSIKPLSGSEEAVSGEEFEVSIWVDQNIPNIIDYFYNLKVLYTQDTLSCKGIVFNGVLHDPNDLLISAGQTSIAWNPWDLTITPPYGLTISVMSLNQFLPAGELFRIRFKALKEGNTTLVLNHISPQAQEQGIFAGATLPLLPYTYEVKAPYTRKGGGGTCFIESLNR